MRRSILAFASALALVSGVTASAGSEPSYVAAAIADKSRPEADVKLDAERKPAELLEFAGVKPDAKVADVWPGKGYFSHLFSSAVGSHGHVYLWVPQEIADMHDTLKITQKFATLFANVSVISAPIKDFSTPEKLDVVWLRQNYHDLHDKFMGPADVASFNKSVYRSLKPGGVFVVVDHVAAAGSGLRDTDTLHRIDPAVVKAEVEAAGFKFDGQSNVLSNPADDHSKLVFDASIRGHTDQFAYRFRKPRH